MVDRGNECFKVVIKNVRTLLGISKESGTTLKNNKNYN